MTSFDSPNFINWLYLIWLSGDLLFSPNLTYWLLLSLFVFEVYSFFICSLFALIFLKNSSLSFEAFLPWFSDYIIRGVCWIWMCELGSKKNSTTFELILFLFIFTVVQLHEFIECAKFSSLAASGIFLQFFLWVPWND